MKLKRITNLLLLATLSLFVISACSDDSGSDDTTSERSNSIWETIGNGSGGNTSNTGDNNVDNTTVDDNDDNTTVDSEDDDTINSDGEGTTDGDSDVTETDDEETTDSESEDTETDSESVTDSESDEGNTEGENGNTETDGDGDVTETEDETVYAPITSVNNTFTVKRLNIQYQDIYYNGIVDSSEYSGGLAPSYYYSNNNFAAYYDESAQTLRVIGKIEIAYEAMTKVENVKLNDLRYKYFDDTITVASDRLSEAFTRDEDGNIVFEYPFGFVSNDENRIQYNSNSTIKLTFVLSESTTSFPADEASFKARTRTMTPVNFSEDPYSLQGTYSAGDCHPTSYGTDAGTYVADSTYISDVYLKISDTGTLTFNFYLGPQDSFQVGYDNNYFVTTYTPTFNNSTSWWGQNYVTYGNIAYTTSRGYNGRYYIALEEVTTTEKDGFNVGFLAHRKNNTNKYIQFECYFTKTSDKAN